MYDKLSFLKGLALGLAGKPLEFANRKYADYLYNEYALPALPKWDTEKYPYAYICVFAFPQLFVFAEPVSTSYGYVIGDKPAGMTADLVCDTAEKDYWGGWEDAKDYACSSIVWSNTDVYETSSGENVLSCQKSTPIPIEPLRTYFDGEITVTEDNRTPYTERNYQKTLVSGVSIPEVCVGDRFRVTINGETAEYTVKQFDHKYGDTEGMGNPYVYFEDCEDTGGDWFIQTWFTGFVFDNEIVFCTEKAGTYSIKLERIFAV